MVDQLRQHQEQAGQFMATRPFALLADEAGAGKTAATVHACDLAGARRIAVFCPATVRPHWGREFRRWQQIPREVHVFEGNPSWTPRMGVTVMSHASLVPEQVMTLLRAGPPYDVIVVDEGGEFRRYDAARTRNLYGFRPSSVLGLATPVTAPMPAGLWTHAKQVWHLSATPLVNSAADFYPVFGGPLEGQTSLGSPTWFDFCNRFAEIRADGFGGLKASGLRNEDELRQLLRPWLLRREVDIGVPLNITARKLRVDTAGLVAAMAGLERWTPEKFEQAMLAGEELQDAAISRVRRALGIAKASAVGDHVLAVLAERQGPVVVFYQHTDVRDVLHAQLSPWFVTAWISGGITPTQLGAAEQWLQDGRLDVLLVQIQAGGMGLTLTRSNRVVVAELPWTAAALWQAIKRVHRMTQTRPVEADVLSADCWLENVMVSVVSSKKSMAHVLLDPLSERITL